MNKILTSLAVLAFAAWGTAVAAQELTFENADTDKNGGVSFEELQSLLTSATEEQFADADIDGSGELSMEEFAALVATIPESGDDDANDSEMDSGEDDGE